MPVFLDLIMPTPVAADGNNDVFLAVIGIIIVFAAILLFLKCKKNRK